MAEKQAPALAQHPTRREVLKKAAYIAPAILTLTAVPAFASRGSGWGEHSDKGKGSYKDNKGKGSYKDNKGNHFGWEKQKNK